MLRLLIYMALGLVLAKLIRSLIKTERGEDKIRGIESEDMVMDPNCGVYVPLHEALRKIVKGENLYFCSDDCFKKYKAKVRRG